MNIQHIRLGSADYPNPLATLTNPPPELYVQGASLTELVTRPCVAVVVSRKDTSYGRMATAQLVRDLVREGVVIVSGLALGIDGIAHQAALDAGGQTIAVLPGGPDKIYPASHYHMAQQIITGRGAVITQYPPKTVPYQSNFIARNRLVAGLSNGVLITEAAAKSGSLHTANFALEQGRDVMAVPGDITRPQSVGCNNLIKEGAVPVTSVADILNQLKIPTQAWPEHEGLQLNHAEFVLLSLLRQGITSEAELLDRSNLTSTEFGQTIIMLEISGRAERLGSQWFLK